MPNNYFVFVIWPKHSCPNAQHLNMAIQMIQDVCQEGEGVRFFNIDDDIYDYIVELKGYHILAVTMLEEVEDSILQAMISLNIRDHGVEWVQKGVTDYTSISNAQDVSFFSNKYE